MSVPWGEFASAVPDLAKLGLQHLYKYGPGLAFLATVRADGGPRVHPVCPTVFEDRLWVLLGDSPKQRDLRRDARYALHTFPDDATDDEFYVTGQAVAVDDAPLRERVSTDMKSRGVNTGDDDALFELLLKRALHAKYEYRGQSPPQYTKWRASSSA
jgi:hypothetical protein